MITSHEVIVLLEVMAWRAGQWCLREPPCSPPRLGIYLPTPHTLPCVACHGVVGSPAFLLLSSMWSPLGVRYCYTCVLSAREVTQLGLTDCDPMRL